MSWETAVGCLTISRFSRSSSSLLSVFSLRRCTGQMRTQAVSQTLLSLSLSFALFADQVAAFLFSSLLCFMGLFLPLSRCQIGCISVSLSDPSSLPKPEVSSLFPRSRPLCFLGFFFSQSRSLSLRHSSGFSPFPSFAFFCFPLFSRCI